MSTLVTGANGFVGRAVCSTLGARGFRTRAAVRRGGISIPGTDDLLIAPGMLEGQLPEGALAGVDCIVHAAARVHVMNDTAADPLAEFRRVNVDGTVQLARHAAAAGVRRFVFLSSIKVNGQGNAPGQPYRADDVPGPADPYGVSKLEAEWGLLEVAAETGMEVVIIRPVLVYGRGVKGNFAAMLRWLSRGVPLPFGAVHNRRSLVALDNLVDLLVTCIAHPAAANEVFLVGDGEDLSTTELLRRSARAMGRSAVLLPIPVPMMESAASLLGKRAVAQRLFGSLQVDISKTRDLLGWRPPVSVDEALSRAVAPGRLEAPPR